MQCNITLSCILFLLNGSGLFAQTFQLAGMEYTNHLKSAIKSSSTNQQMESHVTGFFINMPIKFKNKKTVLLNTLRYGSVQQISYNSPLFLNAKNQKHLHTISLSPMLMQKMGKKWTLIAALTPTLATDFEAKLNSRDLLLQGTLLASAKLHEQWTLGGGLIYTAQLGEPRFLPAVQLRYLKNKHFFNILLPSYVQYLYQPDKKKKWRTGLRWETTGGNFKVANSSFVQIFPTPIHRVIASRMNMGPIIKLQITKIIQLEAFGGMSFGRKFKLQDAMKYNYNFNSESGGFFNLGVILTAPQPKNQADTHVDK